ncbi:MAG: IucA/IucC family siderophore biosynthesis protein [Pseudonocardiaceae bacterium]|nr:IucA/IucC family siderophore biosynthesis protein [Pseudonocardiaceae bacterium]
MIDQQRLVHRLTGARARAERAAQQRLLNAFLRETGHTAVPRGPLRLPLPASGAVLLGTVARRSVFGHHVYGPEFRVQDEAPGSPAVPLDHDGLVRLLLAELDARAGDGGGSARCAELSAQIENSVARTSRYLAHRRPPTPPPTDPAALIRHAEQSLLFGHPFHPTPKSAEGFDEDDLARYAPELGASFPLCFVAVAPELLVERRVAPGPWVPPEVANAARRALGPDRHDRALLPVHPWQAGYLMRQEPVEELVAQGLLISLGPLGAEVYPTSSVRTVCAPAFPTAWKLPLHVRITNFVRTNPMDHVRRAADASLLLGALRPGWAHPGFDVLLETGYRTVNHPELADDLAVLYREHPFARRGEAPRVVAGLLEERPDAEPDLVQEVRRASRCPSGPVPAEHVAEWLRRYLRISLLPLLALFRTDGVSLEAHVQNSLVCLDDGWPVRFFVRDMEGISVSRQTLAGGPEPELLPADSPVLYPESEAWMRLKYYLLTNHIGHLVHVLARAGGADEERLWRVLREVLRSGVADCWTEDLLESPALPAKANLTSRFTGRGERPLYVQVPNPICEVSP